MKLFLSHSGERSRRLARFLSTWLPSLDPELQTWLDQTDLEAGKAWSPQLREALAACNAGIICVTPENAKAAWPIAEFGNLWKGTSSVVVPYLIGLSPADLPPPMQQAQAVIADKSGTWKMLQSLTKDVCLQQGESGLRERFERQWPLLETVLSEPVTQPPRERKLGCSMNLVYACVMVGLLSLSAFAIRHGIGLSRELAAKRSAVEQLEDHTRRLQARADRLSAAYRSSERERAEAEAFIRAWPSIPTEAWGWPEESGGQASLPLAQVDLANLPAEVPNEFAQGNVVMFFPHPTGDDVFFPSAPSNDPVPLYERAPRAGAEGQPAIGWIRFGVPYQVLDIALPGYFKVQLLNADLNATEGWTPVVDPISPPFFVTVKIATNGVAIPGWRFQELTHVRWGLPQPVVVVDTNGLARLPTADLDLSSLLPPRVSSDFAPGQVVMFFPSRRVPYPLYAEREPPQGSPHVQAASLRFGVPYRIEDTFDDPKTRSVQLRIRALRPGDEREQGWTEPIRVHSSGPSLVVVRLGTNDWSLPGWRFLRESQRGSAPQVP